MKTQEPSPDPQAAKKLVRRLRRIGTVVITLAVVSASVMYWRGRGDEKLIEDPSMGGFNKANQRQMEMMYGKMGTITEDLVQQLKQPRTQAALILIGGGLIAAGCFYFARLVSRGNESELSEPAEGGTGAR
jgi:flagellar basal body-associated protein FliL